MAGYQVPANRCQRTRETAREHEAQLLVKTVESRAQAVQEYVRTHHTYELPEIIQVGIEGGLPPYLEWLADQVAEPHH